MNEWINWPPTVDETKIEIDHEWRARSLELKQALIDAFMKGENITPWVMLLQEQLEKKS